MSTAAAVASSQRRASLARSGRFVALRAQHAIEIVDAIGTAPRTRIHGDAIDFACVGTALWILRDGSLDRYSLASGRALEGTVALAGALRLVTDREDSAIVEADEQRVLIAQTGTAPLPAALAAFPLGGRRIAAVLADAPAMLQVLELGRREPLAVIRIEGAVKAACSLHGGRVIAVQSRTATHDVWSVWQAATRVHRVAVPHADRWTVASDAGEALGIIGDRWMRVDLRYGRVRGTGPLPFATDDIAISANAQHVLLTAGDEITHLPAVELFAHARPEARADAGEATCADVRDHAIDHAIDLGTASDEALASDHQARDANACQPDTGAPTGDQLATAPVRDRAASGGSDPAPACSGIAREPSRTDVRDSDNLRATPGATKQAGGIARDANACQPDTGGPTGDQLATAPVRDRAASGGSDPAPACSGIAREPSRTDVRDSDSLRATPGATKQAGGIAREPSRTDVRDSDSLRATPGATKQAGGIAREPSRTDVRDSDRLRATPGATKQAGGIAREPSRTDVRDSDSLRASPDPAPACSGIAREPSRTDVRDSDSLRASPDTAPRSGVAHEPSRADVRDSDGLHASASVGADTVSESDITAIAEAPGNLAAAVVRQPDIATERVPLALGAELPPLTIDRESAADPGGPWHPYPKGTCSPGGSLAYASAREHLDDMLDLVAARAARAIAEAWNSGRLSAEGDRQPFEREVRALLGHTPGFAPSELGEADERVAKLAARNAGRVRATLAAGVRLPFIELMRELDLSPTAGHILMVALAPSERGGVARLFGIAGNDTRRAIVDRFLIETVLAGGDRSSSARNTRAAIASELAGDAPLRRHGVLQIDGDPHQPTFEAIAVDPVVISRLREHGTMAPAVRPFAELVIADAARRELVAVTARAHTGDPLRLVLRGRRGAGRRSAIAALAARVGRAVADIDCTRLPRAGGVLPAALRQELRRAVLRGCVPIVSALETLDAADAELQDRLRQVLRAHPGPIVVRAPLEASLPIDPGHDTVVLPALDETARAAFWRAAVVRAGLECRDIDALAARWRIGPGIVEDVIAQTRARLATPDSDAGAALDAIARQHVAARLAHIATPVRRLAEWEQVALADDVVDSIRELVGRIAHRKTVLEHWGFDAKVASARGLTALFYGPPGTGKSMVAGLIARELGLELYRIDLSRIVSKWIGETEKNLAEVFDAAEDGQVVLLFDEADSLFAKRTTDVKSAVDRYANLEVNYLLQRLDSFEGIAILTTNLDGAIDPAFKRRMSVRLQFPFPDEDMRRRLWAAHIPTGAPVAGDFNFGELARRFQLSGGYIRNSALRAAYLAAQERRPLSQAHLLRAVALEYREIGKLAAGGRME